MTVISQLNDTYDTLTSRCKSRRSLCIKMKNKLNSLTPPDLNISKLSRINSISTNREKCNIEICRLHNLNINLRRKIARLMNIQRFRKIGQVIVNISDASLIKNPLQ